MSIWGIGTIDILKDECGDDAPECDGEQEIPEIQLTEIPGDANNCSNNEYALAYHDVKIKRTEPLSFSLYACLNKDNQTWQYKFGANSKININF